MNCLKEITVLFAEKAGRKGSSWTWPFRHLPDKHPKLLQNGSAGGKNYANELKKVVLNQRCAKINLTAVNGKLTR
jgi:hypothetical protein